MSDKTDMQPGEIIYLGLCKLSSGKPGDLWASRKQCDVRENAHATINKASPFKKDRTKYVIGGVYEIDRVEIDDDGRIKRMGGNKVLKRRIDAPELVITAEAFSADIERQAALKRTEAELRRNPRAMAELEEIGRIVGKAHPLKHRELAEGIARIIMENARKARA